MHPWILREKWKPEESVISMAKPGLWIREGAVCLMALVQKVTVIKYTHLSNDQAHTGVRNHRLIVFFTVGPCCFLLSSVYLLKAVFCPPEKLQYCYKPYYAPDAMLSALHLLSLIQYDE